MAKLTFNRVEKKYMLTDEQYNALMPVITEYMTADKYSADEGYSICNLYFDTPDNEVIRRSVAKPYYKEKLRLRTYGVPESDETKAFLEIKKKIGSNVIKRRVVMPLGVIKAFLDTKEIPDCADAIQRQILSEILYFRQVYDVEPTVYISYKRKAFFGKENKDLRVTFDTEILTRRYDLSLEKGSYGENILKEGTHLMEIKIPESMPLWLSKELSRLGIFKISFSKYGTEYRKYVEEHCVSSAVRLTAERSAKKHDASIYFNDIKTAGPKGFGKERNNVNYGRTF